MTLSKQRKQFLKSATKVVAVVLSLFIIACCTLLRLQSFATSGTPPSLDTNTECSPCAKTKPAYCTPLPYQYNKVIWFITDGWAYYRAKSALDNYSNNSILFTHSPIGDRWSHAIYTSWWTGLAPMNMLGFAVKGDQIWESLARAEGRRCELTYDSISSPPEEPNIEGATNYSIRYEGPVWAPIAVGGGKERFEKAYSFDTFHQVNEVYETDPHVYPTLEIDDLKTTLEEVAAREMSFIAHSGLYDKSCHMIDKDNSERKNREAQYLTDYFSDSTLKDFIDNHPDYLLILSSDHGAYEDKISEHFHGDAHTKPNGNIGYVMFYAKDLPPKSQSEIDTVDVAPTVCSFLQDCDIPFHSSGVSMNYYGPNATDSDYLNLYKRNLAQLKKAAKYNGLDFDYDSVEQMLEEGTLSDFQVIRQMTLDLKNLLYDPSLLTKQTAFAIASFTFTTLVAIAFVTYLFKTNFVNWRYALVFFPAATIILSIIPHAREYMQSSDWLFFMWFICAAGVTITSLMAKNFKTILIVGLDAVICGVLYGLNLLLAGTETEKPVAIISSIAFVLLGLYQYFRREQSFFSLSYIAYGLLLFLFFCTKELTPLYFVFGFHVIAFLIYGSVIPCLLFLTVKRRFEKIYLPLSAMLLLVRNGDFSVIVLNVLFTFVLPHLEFPLELPSKSKPSNWKQTAASYSILVYLLHHGYWFFLASNSILDLNVNPVWGSVGLDSWNTFPTLSGGFMGYGKLGFWFVHTFYLLELFAGTNRHTSSRTSFFETPSIFDSFGKHFQGYFEMLTENSESDQNSSLKISPHAIRFAIAYSIVELIFACWSEQFMLMIFSPKQAWRAVACLLAIYSCQTFCWIAYETILKPSRPRVGDENSSGEEMDEDNGIPLVMMEATK